MAFTSPRKAANNGGALEVRTCSIPPSVHGWNARDNVTNMLPSMAVTLTNIIPRPTDTVARAGATFWSTPGEGGVVVPVPVTTLMAYRGTNGTNKLFSVRGTGIYDETTPTLSSHSNVYQTYGTFNLNATSISSSTPTGLANNATVYTATVTFDAGGAQAISVTGSAAQTYGALVSVINGQITNGVCGLYKASLTSGTDYIGTTPAFVFVTNTIGSGGTVAVVDTGVHKLFQSLTLYTGVLSSITGTAPLLSGLTNNLPMQYAQMATQGLTYLFACNGTDNMRRYDTTNGWVDTNLNAVGQQITGLPGGVNSVVNLGVVHTRLFMVVNNSNIVYYLGSNAIAGAVSNLDVGPLLDKGGNIIAVGGWSQDAGTGMQEYTVFVSSAGQAVVFQGIDPSNAALWQLTGVYNIGRPVGKKCLLKYNSDLLILTTKGLVPASKAFITARTDDRIAITTTIANAVYNAIVQVGSNTTGWQILFYPDGQELFINVPTAKQQFVMYTQHNAWSLFSNWNIKAMEVFSGSGVSNTTDVVVFADPNGTVYYYSADTTNFLPQVDVNYGYLTLEWQPAFNYLGQEKFRQKEVTLMRPFVVYNSSAPISVTYGIDYDFVVNTPTGVATLPGVTGQLVGRNMTFPTIPTLRAVWLGAAAVGTAFAPHFLISVPDASQTGGITLTINALELIWRPAGVQSS